MLLFLPSSSWNTRQLFCTKNRNIIKYKIEQNPVYLPDPQNHASSCTLSSNFANWVNSVSLAVPRCWNLASRFYSCVCCLCKAIWAAITLCRSAINVHWAQVQSRQMQRQYRLCPFNQETTPWFRHRAHFGARGGLRSDGPVMVTYCESGIPIRLHREVEAW